MPQFLSGVKLNRRYYHEIVQPILATHFPDLVYSAALMGFGSDVLGYDTPLSTDHEWGPRLLLFLSEEDETTVAPRIFSVLSEQLPTSFLGYSTNFELGTEGEGGPRVRGEAIAGAVKHHIDLWTVDRFLRRELGVESAQTLHAADWLVFPQQKLLEVTAGAMYHDGLGQLIPQRRRFDYYPLAVWLYLISAQWMRLSQEEAFMGRCGDVGDEIGSRIIAVRLVRDLMRLCFLFERRYAPYSKWLGTAFARLACAKSLNPILRNALAATTWQERQCHLSQAYEAVARMHNDLRITAPLDPTVSLYFGRPYIVLYANRFAEATRQAIDDEEIQAIFAKAGYIGGIDQF